MDDPQMISYPAISGEEKSIPMEPVSLNSGRCKGYAFTHPLNAIESFQAEEKKDPERIYFFWSETNKIVYIPLPIE